MKDAPAYDWFPERFWFAVEGWLDRDIVAYKRLLDQQWQRDGLPEDETELSRLVRGKLSARVLEKFPVATDGRRRNPFMETIRTKQRERIAKRRDGAAKTNAKRWQNGSLSDDKTGRLATRSAIPAATHLEGLSDSPPLTTHPVGEVSPTTPLGEKSPSGEGIPPPKSRPSPADIEARRNADEANAEPLPLTVATMPGVTEFRAAWAEWCDYRTDRATTGLKSKRLDWTRRAARNSLLEIERVAPAVGLAAVTARIRQAMSGTWQGLNLDRMDGAIPPPVKPIDPNKRSWEK